MQVFILYVLCVNNSKDTKSLGALSGECQKLSFEIQVFVWQKRLNLMRNVGCQKGSGQCAPGDLVLCRLEAEIQAVQLRAKEELLQGVQIAKDMAERELSSQRAAYERRIEALEAQLVGGRAASSLLCGAPA